MRELTNCPTCNAKLERKNDDMLGDLLVCPNGCGVQDTTEYEWNSFLDDE